MVRMGKASFVYRNGMDEEKREKIIRRILQTPLSLCDWCRWRMHYPCEDIWLAGGLRRCDGFDFDDRIYCRVDCKTLCPRFGVDCHPGPIAEEEVEEEEEEVEEEEEEEEEEKEEEDVMDFNEVVGEEIYQILRDLLKKGKLYLATADWSFYYGYCVEGYTQHVIIGATSKPNLALSFEENQAYGLVTPGPEIIYKKEIITEIREAPYMKSGFTVYIAREPFKVWISHRGVLGYNKAEYNDVEESVEISSLSELAKYFEE